MLKCYLIFILTDHGNYFPLFKICKTILQKIAFKYTPTHNINIWLNRNKNCNYEQAESRSYSYMYSVLLIWLNMAAVDIKESPRGNFPFLRD